MSLVTLESTRRLYGAGVFFQQVDRAVGDFGAFAGRFAHVSVYAVHALALTCIHSVSRIVENAEVLPNTLRLVTGGIELVGMGGRSLPKLLPIQNSLNTILTFLSVKKIIHKVDSYFYNNTVQKEVLRGKFDYWSTISTFIIGLSDGMGAVKGGARNRSIEVIWSRCCYALPFHSFTLSLEKIASVGQVAFAVVGFSLSLTSTISKMASEHKITRKSVLCIADDLSRLVSVLLLQLPYAPCTVLGIVSAAVGNILSITRFI